MSPDKKVRVRFAPSPTGGLHLGGVRTALFNYLFAKKHNGDFILRIEDTDQTRFVEGAEDYINECLAWCGLLPDEGPQLGGNYGPYRQSERKASYRQFAEQLIDAGYAYYAFDTAAELENQRTLYPNFKYNYENRMQLRNSLSLPAEEVAELLASDAPYTVRIKIPNDSSVVFEDLIRGKISFETNLLDDKVLLKADGMPTYHLAVVVDDKAMDISHVFRGEEWLPSAPIHVLLWEYLGWKEDMPHWAHLPLILKPDGNGKLSKRDGDRLGFPVYAMNWKDPESGELTKGFRELGFLPEAFVNMLAVLGWNDGTEQEFFSLEELIEKFSVDRIGKSGAKFDYEKAKWFNHKWIQDKDADSILPALKTTLNEGGVNADQHTDAYVLTVFETIKDRMNMLSEFWEQAHYFFLEPTTYDFGAVAAKWNDEKTEFFKNITQAFQSLEPWEAPAIEGLYKSSIKESGMKMGELMLPLRIMLVGGKFGPDVFLLAALLGKEEVANRLEKALKLLTN